MSCLGKTECEEEKVEYLLLYIKENIPAYEVQLSEEADCNEAIIMVLTSYGAVVGGII